MIIGNSIQSSRKTPLQLAKAFAWDFSKELTSANRKLPSHSGTQQEGPLPRAGFLEKTSTQPGNKTKTPLGAMLKLLECICLIFEWNVAFMEPLVAILRELSQHFCFSSPPVSEAVSHRLLKLQGDCEVLIVFLSG